MTTVNAIGSEALYFLIHLRMLGQVGTFVRLTEQRRIFFGKAVFDK
jgi:hypothetical protein